MDRDMTTLFYQRTSCPSEHALDLFALGDLKKTERRTVADHLERCAVCAEKARVASMGFDAFPEFDADRVVDRLHRMSAGMETPRWVETALGKESPVSSGSRPGRFRRMKWAGAALAACTAAVLVLSVYKTTSKVEESADPVRSKGGLKLEVLRNRDGVVSETLTGDRFSNGDHLRFRVDLPFDGYMMVIGVEHDRSVYPCYPIDGNAMEFSESQGILLPEAVRLDGSQGEEWLHLILCRDAFDISAVRSGTRPGTLAMPPECVWDSFEMDKGSE